jgi:hypothetical protein
MDWNRVEGNWKQMKGKVKEKWGNLTDDDLTAINGQREISLRARFRSAMASRRIRSDRTLTTGTTRRLGSGASPLLDAGPPPIPRGGFVWIRPLPLIFFWIFWATRHPIFRYSKFTSRAGKGNLGNGLVF